MRDDEFLRHYWQPPDPVFARKLQRQFVSRPSISIVPTFDPVKQMRRTLNILGMGLALVVALSPDARSRLWQQLT